MLKGSQPFVVPAARIGRLNACNTLLTPLGISARNSLLNSCTQRIETAISVSSDAWHLAVLALLS
ncbi:hypothetical protein ACC791_37620, partial [Rhizobium ruizarguesonis]